jgi:hypothetical protein
VTFEILDIDYTIALPPKSDYVVVVEFSIFDNDEMTGSGLDQDT